MRPGAGRPLGSNTYKPDFAAQAAKACRAGFTDQELADLFGVAVSTISAWKAEHVEFLEALKAGKAEADDRVERTLYQKALGFTAPVEKAMVVSGELVIVRYNETVHPDTTSIIFWLKNRNPKEWRDKVVQELTWASKKPSEMTNEELDAAYLALQALLPSPDTVK